MKTVNCSSSDDPRISETQAERKERALRNANEAFQRLIATASDTIGFPGEDTSPLAVEQGMILVEELLKIRNQHVRGLIVEFVRAIADLG